MTPHEVLQLVSTAFTLRDPDLYLNVIAEDFSYVALQSAYPDNPAFFEDWNQQREDIFIHTLLSVTLLPPDSISQISFEAINEQEWADSSLFQERYALEVHTVQDELPREYTGLMRLVLVRGEDGGWRIRSWEDEGLTGDSFSMSQLRAAL